MTIKEATLKVMEELVFDEPVRQKDIINKVVKMTNYSYESCRCNSFRNPNAIPELWTKFRKVKHGGYSCFIRDTEAKYSQDYNKPDDYYYLLSFLNESNNIITLSGTNSNCSKVLDPLKTQSIDLSPHSTAIKKNIYTIKEKASYNLDFEGHLTKKKIDYINSIPYEKVLLTFKSSKNDNLLRNITGDVIQSFKYIGKGGARMNCYLFSKCQSFCGDSSKM